MEERLRFVARLLEGEAMIVRCKQGKPYWGARKIRELLVRRLDGDIRSDNGVPFASPNGLFNFSKLSVW